MIFTIESCSALPRAYGTLSVAILVAHYVHGLFDTFWIGSLSHHPVRDRRSLLGMADAHRDEADELPPGDSPGAIARRVVRRSPSRPSGFPPGEPR